MSGVRTAMTAGLVLAALVASTPAHASPLLDAARLRLGPPALPPLPGEQAPPDPAPTPAAKPVTPTTPKTPAARPATSAKPANPASSGGSPSSGTARPSSAGGGASPSTVVAPPPESAGPDFDGPDFDGPDSGDGPPQPEPLSEAPTAGPESEPAAPLGAELPGGEPPAAPRLPPPPRPPYRGTGLFIGAAVTFAVAVSEQAVAHVLVKRRCIDPVQRELEAMEAAMNDPVDPTVDMDGDGVPDILEIDSDAERAGELVVDCIPGVVPALALRVHSDIGLLATIGLATAAGMLRARQRAYDDAFGGRARARLVAHRISGISLIGTGVVTWFATGAGSWGWLSSCKSAQCAGKARILNFTMRDASALMVAAGGALLGYAEAYRRNYDRFERERAISGGPSISVGPSLSPGGAGLTMTGRF